MKMRQLTILAALLAAGIWGAAAPVEAAKPAAPKEPAISAEARAAVEHLGQTLSAQQFSFRVQTIRVYADASGQPLHIYHDSEVTVRRPDRLLATRTGDDGSSKILYDGKTLVVYVADANKYASIPVPGTIEGMLKEATGRFGIDFPLADFLTDEPGKAILSGVTSGRVINTVTIDGTPCLHLFFSQPPGIELELWLEKNDKALPRRLIVTYRALPGQPNFIAGFSKWDFSIHPTDAEFVFQPPAGATQIALKPAAAPAKARKGKQ
ncbi:MAG TPA: DUF2092 domain-containing protein [Stellaceae bacterium]|jgi:hypothetical protein